MSPKAKPKTGPKRRDSSPATRRDATPAVRNATRSGSSSPVPSVRSPRADLASGLRRALRELDSDRKGTIGREDLKSLLLELDDKLTDAKVDEFLESAVKHSKDGSIDYREFIHSIVYGGAEAPKSHTARTPAVDAAEAEPAVAKADAESDTGHVVNVFGSVPRMAQREKLDILDASEVEQITMDELLEIQKLHRPPAVVQRILECTCMILGSRESIRPRAPPEWRKLREFIADDDFIPAVLEFDVKCLARAPALTRFLHERFFGKDPLTYERVLYANTAAAALYKWCSSVVVKAEKVAEPPPEPEPVADPPPSPEAKTPTPPRTPTPPPEPDPIVEEPPPDPVVEEPPPEPDPVVEEPPPEPDPPEPPPEPEPIIEEPPPEPDPPEPEPIVELPVEEEPPLPLTEVELSHLSFRRDAGICPDGWPKDSDCVVCFIWAHLEFRRDAEVCPEGYEEDWQCSTCCMFAGLKRFMFGGDMPAAPGLPVGPRHTELVTTRRD